MAHAVEINMKCSEIHSSKQRWWRHEVKIVLRCPSTSINNACNRKNGCLLPVISAKSVVPTRCPVFDAYPAFGRILQAKSCGPSACRKLHQRISSHVDDPKDLIPQRLCDHEVPQGTCCSLHDQPRRDSACGNVSILKNLNGWLQKFLRLDLEAA